MRDRFGDHCSVISGYAFKSVDLLEEADIPVIKIGNISNGNDVIIDDSTQYVSSDFLEINEKYHIKKGDILISLTGSHINQPNSMVGRTCRNYSETQYLLNQRAGKVIVKRNTDKDYMYYLFMLRAIKESIVTRAYGAANQVNISPAAIEKMKWEFPDISTQKKIGEILSSYDQMIICNNKRIKILEQMAENLYKEWFVRFRFPGHEDVEFDDGKPINWEVLRLEDFGIILESGSRPSGGIDDAIEDGVPSLGAEAVNGLAEYDYSSVKLVPYEFYEKLKRGKNKGNHILVYKDGAYIGKVTIFRNEFPYKEYAINEHVFFLNSVDSEYQNYLYFTLHQDAYFSTMQNLNRNAAQPGLSKPDMNRIKIIVPDKKTVFAFNKYIEPVFDEVFQLAKCNKILIKQRDLLLPRLMSGKLEVK